MHCLQPGPEGSLEQRPRDGVLTAYQALYKALLHRGPLEVPASLRPSGGRGGPRAQDAISFHHYKPDWITTLTGAQGAKYSEMGAPGEAQAGLPPAGFSMDGSNNSTFTKRAHGRKVRGEERDRET